MPYVPFGGLGGLGGMTPAQTNPAPADQQNQFQQFLGGPGFGNAITALGMSLMGSPSNAPLSGFSQALAQTQAQTMAEQDRAMVAQKAEEEKARRAELAKYAQTIAPPNLQGLAATDPEAFLQIWKQMQPEAVTPIEINGQLVDPSTGQVIGDYRTQTAAGSEYGDIGLQPQWGQDAQGNPVLGQMSSTGQFVPTKLPEGVTPMDPRTLTQERAFGTAVGTAQGGATAAAPQQLAGADTALDLVQSIREDPELPWATGTSVGFGGNNIAGTGRYGFQKKVDQAKSGAFLTAISQMRGLGALSDSEGKTATAAVTRMDTAMNQTDFQDALNDYEQIILQGRQRALNLLAGNPNGSQQSAQRPAAPGPTGSTGGFQILSVE